MKLCYPAGLSLLNLERQLRDDARPPTCALSIRMSLIHPSPCRNQKLIAMLDSRDKEAPKHVVGVLCIGQTHGNQKF